ncbi:MAG: hypothetical protein AB7F22_25545 [Reyranella sp.]|uniref:hypothetical protein n=1 Tax=Reyranella sp. TaxID=1929291 RepID=UPI003D0D8633
MTTNNRKPLTFGRKTVETREPPAEQPAPRFKPVAPARRCEFSITIADRDALLEHFAVAAAREADMDHKARIERFADLVKAGELV